MKGKKGKGGKFSLKKKVGQDRIGRVLIYLFFIAAAIGTLIYGLFFLELDQQGDNPFEGVSEPS